MTDEKLRTEWRCFHCDFVTSDRDEAELHFGPKCFYDPMCKMTDAGQRREYIRLDAAYSEVCAKKAASEARVLVLEGALTKLSEEVFGRQAGDEPDVYADYDILNELYRETRSALSPEPIPPNNSTDEVTE